MPYEQNKWQALEASASVDAADPPPLLADNRALQPAPAVPEKVCADGGLSGTQLEFNSNRLMGQGLRD